MNVIIEKSTAKGTVQAPPSKSMAHRYLICAALSEGVSRITNVAFSQDILATMDCVKALGAKVTVEGSTVTVEGIKGAVADHVRFDCRESGSTVRFFIPIAMMLCKSAEFYGSERLLQRPFSVYEDICRKEGIEFNQTEEKIYVSGSLKKYNYSIPGDISSQFATGLLFALALSGEDACVSLTGTVESRSYILLTLAALEKFGIKSEFGSDNTVRLKSGKLTACDAEVEGDYSNAAFLDALNLAGGNVKVTGLASDSLQGDRVYKKFFNMLLSVERPVIDISDCPDLGPVLMAVMALRGGGVLTGTRRLKIKESDRAAAMASELLKFGINCRVLENSVEIDQGKLNKPTGVLLGHNDHRIVMSLATILTVTGGELDGAEAVSKSFPDYFDIIKELGVVCHGMD